MKDDGGWVINNAMEVVDPPLSDVGSGKWEQCSKVEIGIGVFWHGDLGSWTEAGALKVGLASL